MAPPLNENIEATMTQQTLAAPLPGNPSAPSPRARDLVQLTPADYFSVSDIDGKPIASLLVLVDSTKRPVRAELHLNGTATDEIGRQAVRQSQHIIEERYTGPEVLPMQVWQSFLRSDPLHIPLGPVENGAQGAVRAATVESGGMAFIVKLLSIGVVALVLLALLAGIVNRTRAGSPVSITTAPVGGGLTSPSEPASDVTIPETAMPPVDQPLPAEAAAQIDLPVSKFAEPDLTIGRRVRISDTAKLTLRTEPGANAGEAIGYMQDGQQATIIGGPTQLKGISDTIVWWEVQLDDGRTAWAAANDSNMRLLELVD